MGDEAPTTLELTCPGCGAFFRLKPKRGRLPKGPIPCPKCATSIPVPSATTTTSSAEVGAEDSFAQRPRTSKTTAPMAQVMGSGIIKRKKRDGETSQFGETSSEQAPQPPAPAATPEPELPEHSSPRLKAPTAMDRLLDDAPGPGATFLGLPTLGDSGLGVLRAELDAAQEPLRAQRLVDGQVPEYTMPPTSSQQGEFSRDDKTIAADEALLAQLSSQRSTREVPTAHIESSARPEHLRDTQEVDPVDPQEHRKTPIHLERPPVDMFDAPLDDEDDDLLPPGDDWDDAQGPFDLRDILAAEKERGNELSGEITRNPALEGGLYPVPEPSKSKPLPDDSFGAHVKRPRSKHLATLSVSAQSPEREHRETSDRSNSGAFKHARVSTGDIFSETSNALGDDSLFPMFEAKKSPKPWASESDEADLAQLESFEAAEQEEQRQTPRTTAEYDPIAPQEQDAADEAQASQAQPAPQEPPAPQAQEDNEASEASTESTPALSALLKRKIGKKKADELRHKIEQDEQSDPAPGLAQDSGLSSLDALFDEQQGKSKFGPSAISGTPSSSFSSGALISEDDLLEAVSSASESWSQAFEEQDDEPAPSLIASPDHDTSPTREALNPADLWDELAQEEEDKALEASQAQPAEPIQPPREEEIKTPVMALSPPMLPESSKPLVSALKAKLLERQSSLQERSEAQAPPPLAKPLLEATKPKLSLLSASKAQDPPPRPARPTELPTLDLKTPSEVEAEPNFNDRSGTPLISGFPTSSQSTDELRIIRSKRRRGGGESQSGLFARPLADGLGQESSVTMGMAGERRGSGYIRLPTTEILEVLGQGSYRLMVEDIVYEPVDEQGLVDLIKQGVLLGAEQIAEADGDWTSIAEHPVFKRLRKKMAMEAHAVLAKYKRQAAQSSDQLPATQSAPPQTPKKSEAKGITKPLTPVSPVVEAPQAEAQADEPKPQRVSQELTIELENPHHEETKELQFNPQEAQLLGRQEPEEQEPALQEQQEQQEQQAPVDETALFFDDELEAELQEEAMPVHIEPQPELEDEPASEELAPTPHHYTDAPAQDELEEPELSPQPSKARWLLPLLLVLLLCGLAVGLVAKFKPELLGLAVTQPIPPTKTNNATPPLTNTPPVIAATADAGPDASPEVAEPEIEKSDLERALAFEQEGNFADAIPLLEKLHKGAPKDIDNISFLTRAYLGDKRFSSARALSLVGLSLPKLKKDEAEQLQKLYQQSIISDPLLTQTNARLLKLDEDLDALHFIEEDKLFQVKVLKEGKTTHVFKPAQVEWGSGWRQEIATWRLSELMASNFSVPQTEAARISEDDFMALYQRHDSELQKKGLNRIREWDELDWTNEKGPDGVKRRYLYGALQRWVEPRVPFPVEYTNAWQDLVNVNEDERALEQPITKTLEPIERADKARYDQIITQLGDLDTKAMASQLSDLMIMDYLINHRPRFERRSEDYGKATQLHDGKLYSLMHGVSWGLRASSTISSRFRNVSRFSRQSITALELMEPKFVDGILFPNADSREKKRLKIFWSQRNKTLRKVKKLTEDYSQDAVLHFP